MIEEWIRGSDDKEKTEKLPNMGKKSKYLLVLIISLGILALIWPMGKTPEEETTKIIDSTNIKQSSVETGNVKNELSRELEAILSQINGAGIVNVSLNLSSEGVKTYATNKRDERRETYETDNTGGDRKIIEENQTRDLAVSTGEALLLEKKSPEVVGVLVVAEGARSSVIKEKLTDVTSTLLNISPHQVRVVPRKGD
ncbi:hypothetical protein SYNTR_0363 [Candidatus Syntrophocurvum alkaliphilum]|uniref:Stage III sporulation protein AG n=1 Tax=Candidatus Syntrophocurvum alkaliphilum TaxID=2293317 RepID=A0A6I6D6X4_9FIRM|nr:hypothetical protein [Candidatus Syntrophocurvum alkaliphilum]QGT98956.1 hypothetical protein SYNTR_0363 [Candidatus Syntrophocurvum alkaliphilum]